MPRIETEIAPLLTAVRSGRKTVERAKVELAEKRAQFEVENASLIALVAGLTEQLDAYEKDLRAVAVLEYTESGNRKPVVGVEVKLFSVYDYDAKEAEAWGWEHRMALKFDKTAFEKIAKASPLPFVTVREEPRTTIATQL